MKLFFLMVKALLLIIVGEMVLSTLVPGIAGIICGVKLIKRNTKSKAWNILFVLLIAFGALYIFFAIVGLIWIVIICYAMT